MQRAIISVGYAYCLSTILCLSLLAFKPHQVAPTVSAAWLLSGVGLLGTLLVMSLRKRRQPLIGQNLIASHAARLYFGTAAVILGLWMVNVGVASAIGVFGLLMILLGLGSVATNAVVWVFRDITAAGGAR